MVRLTSLSGYGVVDDDDDDDVVPVRDDVLLVRDFEGEEEEG
jgi:hypothetical protein